jgi:hypothetical protein
LKEHIGKEAVMVINAYTVIYPRTVVVESLNAFMTYAAMSAPGSPYS